MAVIITHEKENVKRRGSLFHLKKMKSEDGRQYFTRKIERLKTAVIISHEKENA